MNDYELLKEAVRKTLVSCPNFASNEFVKNDLCVQRAIREIEEEKNGAYGHADDEGNK